MVESQPLVAVRNVRAGSRWYADLLDPDGYVVVLASPDGECA